MSRRIAREYLFKMVFETLFVEPSETTSYEDFLKNEELDEENKNFVKDNFSSILKNKEELMDILKSTLTDNFSIDRIFKVDMAILLVALNEIKYYKQTPVKVVVNEAIDISKKYSTEKSYSFINGVLAKYIKNNNIE